MNFLWYLKLRCVWWYQTYLINYAVEFIQLLVYLLGAFFIVCSPCLFFGCTTHLACGILVPDQRWSPSPLQWKHGVLTTGLPGKSCKVPLLLCCLRERRPHARTCQSDCHPLQLFCFSELHWVQEAPLWASVYSVPPSQIPETDPAGLLYVMYSSHPWER